MSNLYGIESRDDCRAKIDELLEMCHRTEQTMNKETMASLKASLKKYYKMGDTNKGSIKMSPDESAFFYPAIREAYVRSPKLNSQKTWREGLYEIESNLRYYRDQLGQSEPV
jgi:hypothetical protein